VNLLGAAAFFLFAGSLALPELLGPAIVCLAAALLLAAFHVGRGFGYVESLDDVERLLAEHEEQGNPLPVAHTSLVDHIASQREAGRLGRQ
jgi:hypothetical protein